MCGQGRTGGQAVKIKDPARAVRVLKFVTVSMKDDVSPNVQMLVAGIKAVLEEYKKSRFSSWTVELNRADSFVIALGQAYAERMAEAGMEVPA